jgi:hypothetical protein
MKIFASKYAETPPRAVYATAGDFCRIFENNMDDLYLLSLLLTADHDLAGKCFAAGLETAKGSSPVFKEWAESWARRTIISNAIRIIGPRVDSASDEVREVKGLPPELDAVAQLKTFDRFVFVISVLEGYAERDCKLLLDCSATDISRARTRALQHLATLARQRGDAPAVTVADTIAKTNAKNVQQYLERLRRSIAMKPVMATS